MGFLYLAYVPLSLRYDEGTLGCPCVGTEWFLFHYGARSQEFS